MTRRTEERLIELYEKGILTKEETRACFEEYDQEPDFLFVEEKHKPSFVFPRFKVFSFSKIKEQYCFEHIESVFIQLSEGQVSLNKSKTGDVEVEVVAEQEEGKEAYQLSVEQNNLYFTSEDTCHLTIRLPQEWMAVLDIELGQADAYLDYLPFEDISIRSGRDHKQQDIRLTTCGGYLQHLDFQLAHASIILQTGKKQGIQGRIGSSLGQVLVNRRQKQSPYEFEKQGEDLLLMRGNLGQGAFYMKGIRDVN